MPYCKMLQHANYQDSYHNALHIGRRRCKCNELAPVMLFINPETDYAFASIFHMFESQVPTSTALRTNGCRLK